MEPMEAWIWIEGHGWMEGAIDAEGVYFAERPPDVRPHTKVIAVERTPWEHEPPGVVETARLLTSIQSGGLDQI